MPLLDILQEAVRQEASDVLIIAGLPVSYKVHGRIDRVGERLLPDATGALAEELYALAKRSMDRFLETGDDDFSFAIPGLSRFRVNALKQRGSLALVVRVVSFALPDRTALGIPDNVMAFANAPHGLVLFTGPAGSGKTTTLACLVDAVNTTREAHVITIEDPLEYLHQHKKSVVTQRELYTDTQSYEAALRAACSIALLRKNRAEALWETLEYAVEKNASEEPVQDRNRMTDGAHIIRIQNEYGLPIRISRLLAEQLGLSGGKLKELEEAGRLEMPEGTTLRTKLGGWVTLFFTE